MQLWVGEAWQGPPLTPARLGEGFWGHRCRAATRQVACVEPSFFSRRFCGICSSSIALMRRALQAAVVGSGDWMEDMSFFFA